jgi:N-acetylneuraminic acid mutarotase
MEKVAMTKVRQVLAVVTAGGLLLGCQPAGYGPLPGRRAAITVSVVPAAAFATTAAPKGLGDVAKVRLRLYRLPANTVAATQAITWQGTLMGTGTFTEVGDGSYRVGADALDSTDTSITLGGEQFTLGSISVSGGQVSYPGGLDRVGVSLRLNNGTGQRVVMEAGIAGYAGNTVTPSQYRYSLVRTSDNQTVATYTSAQTLTHFAQVPDGTYRMTAEALDAGNRSITAGGATASTNTVTVQAPNVTYSNANGTKLLASLPLFYDRWFSKAGMLTAVEGIGAAATGGRVYVPGGYNGTTVTQAFYAYDIAGDSWSPRQLVPTARRDMAVATVNGLVYTIGGHAGSTDSDVMEIYNPLTDTWATGPSLAVGRSGAAACVVGSRIYVIGGYNFNVPPRLLPTMEIFDTATNTWSTGAPMTTARMRLSAAAVNGIVYAVGGDALPATSAVEAYDPATNTWQTKAPLPAARYYLAAAGVGNALYVLGGYGSNVSQAGVYAYSPATNTWSGRTAMGTPRKGHAVAVDNNRIYVCGGDNYTTADNYLDSMEMYEP